MFAVPPHHGPERRAFIRLPYETEARGVASDAHEGLIRVRDVSRIGLGLDSPCPLELGSSVAFAFEDVYFEDAPLSLQGHVVWVCPVGARYRIGIALAHSDSRSIIAASELFYAALAGLSSRLEANYARVLRE